MKSPLSPPHDPAHRLAKLAFLVVFTLSVIASSASLLQGQPQDQPHHHDHAGMTMNEPLTPAQQAKLFADKRESEFNHHLAGFFLVLAGLLILSDSILHNRIGIARYAWPVCFLASGLFVLVYSDTELWPFGRKPWIEGTLTNHEVLQHKTFALMLLILGGIELARSRRKLTAAWSAWVFPAFAMVGSVLLLFHSHDAGMLGPDHMATMERIQTQHFSYSGLGVGIGLTKGLSEIPSRWQLVFAKIYPVLLIALGILLMLYVE